MSWGAVVAPKLLAAAGFFLRSTKRKRTFTSHNLSPTRPAPPRSNHTLWFFSSISLSLIYSSWNIWTASKEISPPPIATYTQISFFTVSQKQPQRTIHPPHFQSYLSRSSYSGIIHQPFLKCDQDLPPTSQGALQWLHFTLVWARRWTPPSSTTPTPRTVLPAVWVRRETTNKFVPFAWRCLPTRRQSAFRLFFPGQLLKTTTLCCSKAIWTILRPIFMHAMVGTENCVRSCWVIFLLRVS